MFVLSEPRSFDNALNEFRIGEREEVPSGSSFWYDLSAINVHTKLSMTSSMYTHSRSAVRKKRRGYQISSSIHGTFTVSLPENGELQPTSSQSLM